MVTTVILTATKSVAGVVGRWRTYETSVKDRRAMVGARDDARSCKWRAFPPLKSELIHHRFMTMNDPCTLDLPVLTRKDVATNLGLSERTVDRLVAKGEFPHHRIGDLVRFTERNIEDFVTSCRIPAPLSICVSDTTLTDMTGDDAAEAITTGP
jgi:excisionase family DNA binding protein